MSETSGVGLMDRPINDEIANDYENVNRLGQQGFNELPPQYVDAPTSAEPTIGTGDNRDQEPPGDGDERPAAFTYTRANGVVETAGSIEEARAKCTKYLGQLPMEQASILMKAHARGQARLAEQQRNKQKAEHDPVWSQDKAPAVPAVANPKTKDAVLTPAKREVEHTEKLEKLEKPQVIESAAVAERIHEQKRQHELLQRQHMLELTRASKKPGTSKKVAEVAKSVGTKQRNRIKLSGKPKSKIAISSPARAMIAPAAAMPADKAPAVPPTLAIVEKPLIEQAPARNPTPIERIVDAPQTAVIEAAQPRVELQLNNSELTDPLPLVVDKLELDVLRDQYDASLAQEAADYDEGVLMADIPNWYDADMFEEVEADFDSELQILASDIDADLTANGEFETSNFMETEDLDLIDSIRSVSITETEPVDDEPLIDGIMHNTESAGLEEDENFLSVESEKVYNDSRAMDTYYKLVALLDSKDTSEIAPVDTMYVAESNTAEVIADDDSLATAIDVEVATPTVQRPTLETLVRPATLAPEVSSAEVSRSEDVDNILREIAALLPEPIVADVSDEWLPKDVITPEIIQKALVLLDLLGCEDPQAVLLGFVSHYGYTALVQVLQESALQAVQRFDKEEFQPHAVSNSQVSTADSFVARLGQAVFNLIAKQPLFTAAD